MRTITVVRRVYPERLAQELAVLPGLASIIGRFGLPEARFLVTTDARGVTTLTVPDDADDAAIAAVVAAHDPTPAVPPVRPDFGNDSATADQLADAVTQLRAYLALASPTNVQTIAAFKILIRVCLFVLRRLP